MDESGRFRLLAEEEKKQYHAEPFEEKLPEEQEEDTLEFALESMLEEYIYRNWNNIDFGEPLELYEGRKGRQFHTDIGIIDFLCKNKNSGEFIVIELKKGRKSDEVIGQILRYIGWVKKNLAKDENIRGLVITADEDKKLDTAASAVPFVSVRRYKVTFDLHS
jgi:RecB family endonuclease NucS